MKPRYYFIGFITIIVVVIMLNFILSRDVLFDYKVVGEGKDWLSFYGSIISSTVAFYALFRTIKSNRNNTQIDRMHQDLKDLRNDLSERIAAINISRILQVVLAGNDFNITSELYRLDALAQDYIKLSNSTYFKYGIIDNDNAKAFYTTYCSLIDDLVRIDINGLTILLTKMKDERITINDYNEELLKITKRITKERQKFFDDRVYSAAIQYYKCESSKLKKRSYFY